MTPTAQTRRTSDDHGFTLHDLPADAEGAADFRHQFTHWTDHTIPTTDQRRYDIVLATYEAVANAAEHAYAPGTDGTVTVTARYRPGTRTLDVTITDQGAWKTTEPDDSRGRGLLIIRALSDAEDIISGPTGTTVVLQWRLFV